VCWSQAAKGCVFPAYDLDNFGLSAAGKRVPGFEFRVPSSACLGVLKPFGCNESERQKPQRSQRRGKRKGRKGGFGRVAGSVCLGVVKPFG
jgi:hypothetical protein